MRRGQRQSESAKQKLRDAALKRHFLCRQEKAYDARIAGKSHPDNAGTMQDAHKVLGVFGPAADTVQVDINTPGPAAAVSASGPVAPVGPLTVEELLSGKIGKSGFDFSIIRDHVKAGSEFVNVCAAVLIPGTTLGQYIKAEGLAWEDFRQWGIKARVAGAKLALQREAEAGDQKAIAMVLELKREESGSLFEQYQRCWRRLNYIYGRMSEQEKAEVNKMLEKSIAESQEVLAMSPTPSFAHLSDTIKVLPPMSDDEHELYCKWGYTGDEIADFERRGVDLAAITKLRAAGVLPADIQQQIHAGTPSLIVTKLETPGVTPDKDNNGDPSIAQVVYVPDIRVSLRRPVTAIPDVDIPDVLE
jgi:hypothetical protein